MSFLITGNVHFDNVTALCEDGRTYIDSVQGEATVDFAQVEQIDSSAAALLLDWLRYAKQHAKTLSCINMPESLRAMIRIGGISEFFIG